MKVLVFDTECTDRKEGREIIEAAWLDLEPEADLLEAPSDRITQPLRIGSVFCERYKPETPIKFGAMAVHHILPHELEACAPSASFQIPASANYLVGHSIDFDWIAAGSPAHVKRICTHALAQHVWPEADSHSQSALLYQVLGATPATRAALQGAHSALTDVRNNLALLTSILEQRPLLTTWSALHAYSEECRIPIYCPMKRWEGLRLDEMDSGSIDWCLRQDWLDPYLRIGFERVLRQREESFRARWNERHGADLSRQEAS